MGIPIARKLSPEKHTDEGYEIVDEVPVASPLDLQKAPSLYEMVQQQLMAENIKAWEAEFGTETEEEADDFYVEDDIEPMSMHENDHVPTIAELRKQVEEINKEIEQRNRESYLEEYFKRYPDKKPPAPEGEPPSRDLREQGVPKKEKPKKED